MNEELRDFGLSENEILLYLALLKTGKETANRIAQITGMKRSTTYDNFKLLINKGIVSRFTKNNVQHFEAADPKKLVHLIEDKKKKIQKIIPDLIKIQKTSTEKTGVTFYEGKRGVLTVLNDIIDQKEELWFYGSRKMALIAFKHYPDNFVQKRSEAKIKLRAVLALEDKGDKIYKIDQISKLSKIKYSKEMNKVSSNTFIYGDRVAFMTSEDDPTGIIIKNSKIVQQQKKIFEILWKTAKK